MESKYRSVVNSTALEKLNDRSGEKYILFVNETDTKDAFLVFKRISPNSYACKVYALRCEYTHSSSLNLSASNHKEIKLYLRKKLAKYHPDRNKEPNAASMFKKVNKEYQNFIKSKMVNDSSIYNEEDLICVNSFMNEPTLIGTISVEELDKYLLENSGSTRDDFIKLLIGKMEEPIHNLNNKTK